MALLELLIDESWGWRLFRVWGETSGVKGTVPRDFLLQVFFMRHCDQCKFGGPPVSLTPAGNFATGFNDAGGQFAGGIVDTGDAAWAANIFTNL
jgi:hypothetical protein